MTPAELKAHVENAGHERHFFNRATMKFFGDTMANYGVRAKPVMVPTYSEVVECWELYRRRPNKKGLQGSAYFCTQTFQQRFKRNDQ